MGNLAFILLGLCCGFHGVFGHGINPLLLSLHVFMPVCPQGPCTTPTRGGPLKAAMLMKDAGYSCQRNFPH